MAFSLANVFQLGSGAVSLPIIGYILDHNWTGTMAHHAHVYMLTNYHKALLVMPLSIALSWIFTLFIPEPKVQHDEDKVTTTTSIKTILTARPIDYR